MKKNIFFLLFMFFGYISIFGQIGLNESFDNGIPAGWTNTFAASTAQACDGQSIRDNLYSFNDTGQLLSPNIVGQSNETDLTVSFDYKIVDWSAATNATAPGWGSFTVDYSTDGGTTWVNLGTIDDSNHVVSSDCATITYSVPAADLPEGSDFQLRFDIVWAAGDYYMYYDNVSALQVALDPPNCDAVLTTPADGANDVQIDDNTIFWSGATGIPTSYTLTVGTTSGGTDVVDNENVGNVTSYDFGSNFAYDTTYYVTIVPENGEGVATGCTEYSFTTVQDPSITVDCSGGGPENVNFCYENGEITEYIFISSDGSALNLVVNEGQVESGWDEFIVLDTDGTELYNGYGVSGDISGLTFQSSGDQITVQVTPDTAIGCASSGYTPIDITVSCATCIMPTAEFEVVSDCINGAQFRVDVDLTSIGDATDVTVSDNQGNSEVYDTVGVYNFGPYPNNTDVEFTIENNQDANCVISSPSLTQEYCSDNYLDCGEGPINTVFCYDSNETVELTYISNDGSVLNLDVNSGMINTFGGSFDVIDTDDEVLYSGYGNDGDLSGLNFQSSGDTITISYTAGFNDCEGFSSSAIDLTVECSNCINPSASYEVVSNCGSGDDEFLVEVSISDLGSASSLTVSDNQGSVTETATEAGIITFGPYANNTNIQITIENDDDTSCVLNSQSLTQVACPPENDACVDALPAVINTEQFCVNTTSVGISGATASSVPVSCGGSVVQDVWYEFTAIAPDHIITLINAPFSVTHAIYEGECDDLTEMYCSAEFDNFGNSPGIVATGLTIGETYYIRIFSSATTMGNFELCITSPDYELDNTSCANVAPFCAPFDSSGNPEPLIFANGYYYLEESTAEAGPDYDCLGSQPNPAWFYLQVDEAGDLEFEIVQNTAFDGNANTIGEGLDVDFIVYGPFSELEGNCDDLTDANIVDCSYSGLAIENMTLADTQAGDIYLVLITNFEQTPGYISLIQTNYGETGGGTTDCSILDNIIYACEGTEVTLEASFPEDAGFVWYESCDEEFENCTMIPIEQESGPSIVVDEEGYYKVVSFTNEGIERPEETFTVIYSPSPELAMDELQSLCGVTSLDLDATPTNATEFGSFTYTWYQDGDQISAETSSTLNITEPGEYTVEVSGTILDENGNEIADQSCSAQMVVEVTNSEFTVDLGGNQSYCDDSMQDLNAVITGTPADDATYTWYYDGDEISGETTQTISVNEDGNYQVEVNINGCVETQNVDLLFDLRPQVDLGEDTSVCDLSINILDATPANMDVSEVTFEWSYEGSVITGETTPTLDPSIYGFGMYEVTVVSLDDPSMTCAAIENIRLSNTQLNVSVGAAEGSSAIVDVQYCEEDGVPTQEIMLNADANGEGIDASGITYIWYMNGVEIPGETGSSYTAVYEEAGEYNDEYTVDAYYEASCSGSASISAEVSIEPYGSGCTITQGISPNADGMNDCLDLTFLSERSGIASLKVYNRYGRLIFESSNYVDSFCGQNEDGEALVTGTYFYVLEMEREDPVFGNSTKGWIYVNQVE